MDAQSRFSQSCLLPLAMAFALLALGPWFAQPLRGAGVTVITHGFTGNITDWIIPMADRYLGHPGFPGTEISCYEIEVTSGGVSAGFLGGTAPTVADSGEILVKLDWATLAGFFQASSTEIAEAAAGALISTTLIPELGGRSLAELPMHLIGHSRGGSVVTELARFLGAQGVWVDQVTTLDPWPVGLFGDAGVTTYTNVLFADNYWQTDGGGQAVFGSYNRLLTVLGGGYSSSHSDVHLWYHGTIELGTPASDTGATITAAERSSWWTAPEAAGATAGNFYSLIGGGNRRSDVEPAGPGNGRISDGYNRHWDLGDGVASNRTALPVNSGLWPNVILCGPANANPVPLGGDFPLVLYHQSGASATGTVEVKVLLDMDFNPWSGDEVEVDQLFPANTGTGAVGYGTPSVSVGAGAVTPGTYAVCARISDGARTRYLYAPTLLTVMPGLEPPRIDGATVGLSGGLMGFDVLGSIGQEVVVKGSVNLVDWTEVETHTMTSTVWGFEDGETAMFPRRYYRVGEGE